MVDVLLPDVGSPKFQLQVDAASPKKLDAFVKCVELLTQESVFVKSGSGNGCVFTFVTEELKHPPLAFTVSVTGWNNVSEKRWLGF